MTIITLLTDFGLSDGYAGVMKGVIWGIAPQVQIADISHAIHPQDVLQGCLALKRTARFFPPDTIHVAVVDPGVGTHRRPLAMRLGAQTFVGPDNGLFTAVLEVAESRGEKIQIVHLNQPQYWLPEVSHVFHGRDIFAPSAAHLANGTLIGSMGIPIQDPVRLHIPTPKFAPSGSCIGQVTEIDYFGNLSTNISRSDLITWEAVQVGIKNLQIDGLVNTFGERSPGTLIALFGTADDLVISVVNGSAALLLGAKVGDVVEVTPIGKRG